MNSSEDKISPTNRLGLRRLAQDSLINFVRQTYSIIIAFLISILLARGLGREGRGLFTLCLLLPETVITFANLGISASSVFFISRKIYTPGEVLRQSISLSVWISGAAMIVGYQIISVFGKLLFSSVPAEYLYLSLLIIPINLANSFLVSIFQGQQDFRSFNIPGMVNQFSFALMLCLNIWLLNLGVTGALLAYLSGAVVSLIFFILFARNRITSIVSVPLFPDKAYLRNIFTYSIQIHVSNIFRYLLRRIDNLILNGIAGPEAVGAYSIAVGLGERLWLPANAISSTIFPKIASLHNEREKQFAITPLLSRVVFGITLPASVFIALIAKWAIPFLYGELFAVSVKPFLYLLPGIIALNFGIIFSNDLAGQGQVGKNLLYSGISFAVNVVANLFFIPEYGSSGASIASSISYSVFALLFIINYTRSSSIPWYHLVFPQRNDLKMAKQAIKEAWTHIVALKPNTKTRI